MNRNDFWSEIWTFRGCVTPYIKGRVLAFGALATLVWLLATYTGFETGMGVAPYEIIGVVLALLLVLRTNSGYDRWYEGRKLWGGIVNQSRNLGVIGITYGPRDAAWREEFIRWTAAFSHACRHSLRDERDLDDMQGLLTRDELDDLAASQHMPTYVANRLSQLLRQAVDEGGMDRFAFLQAESERSQLIDHIGSCERILKTPLAAVFSMKIRRFLFLYLVTLPFAIVDKVFGLTPLITLLVAYPLLSLDQIGIELQNPFSKQRLGHLPLEEIANTIEANLMALLETGGDSAPQGAPHNRQMVA